MSKTNLEQVIEKAATDFAMTIMGAVKNATLQELMMLHEGTAPPKPGRKPKTESASAKPQSKRLSRADKVVLLDNIVAYLRENPNSGCNAIAQNFGTPPRKMGIYLKELRTQGKVTTMGNKIAMTYSVQ